MIRVWGGGGRGEHCQTYIILGSYDAILQSVQYLEEQPPLSSTSRRPYEQRLRYCYQLSQGSKVSFIPHLCKAPSLIITRFRST